MEPLELSPALLQPQDSAVAILGELLDTLPRENEMLLGSAVSLHRDLEEFTRQLRDLLFRTDDTWRCWNVTNDDVNPLTALSQALVAYDSTSGTPQKPELWPFLRWPMSLGGIEKSWAELAKKATKLHNTCKEVATEAASEEATATTQAWELQDEAAHDGTAQENMVELGQALGREEGAEVVAGHGAQVRREAMEAAREATRATMERQQLEAALGLLERLVATCDEAAVFPRELEWRLRDTETALEGTNEASPDVPEDLVAKVAEAERLWEANARLPKNHLLGAVQEIIKFYFNGGAASPSAHGVAEWCQRAIEDIPRLLRPPEHAQNIPKISPMCMELQELSPALLQPQVTVVATLGELLATLPRRDEEMMMLLKSPMCLYSELVGITAEFSCTPYGIDEAWYHRNGNSVEKPPTSLSQALAAYKSTPWTTWLHVRMVAKKWQEAVDWHVKNWAKTSRKATKLLNACRVTVTELTDKVATNTARARELQDKAARDGTAQENMVELGQALGREEGAEVVARHGAQVRREARVAASLATRASRRRQRLDAALGLLERLVAACDEAAAFTQELQRRVGDIKASLKGTNEASSHVTEDLVAKVAVAERLWEANTRLAKDHLEGTHEYIYRFYIRDEPVSLSACGVAERCQRAIEDIPRLLRPPEHPQSVPKVSLPQVTVVAILGELLDTLPMVDEEMLVFMSPGCLYWVLEEFTNELRVTLYRIEDNCWRRNVTSNDHDPLTSNDDCPVTSLSRALDAYRSTPGTSRDNVAKAASEWHRSVSVLVDSWAELARKATKLRNTCRDLATEAASWESFRTRRARELQDKAARDGTAQENSGELGLAQGGVERAEVVAGQETEVREEARVAASEATRATMERQQMEAALGLLQCLVAACDEATAFPRELQRRVGDIEAALEGTSEASPDVPEDLVAKVAVAERLWEANARLAKDHLLGPLQDIIGFYFTGGPTRICRVAEWCPQ
ncbi:uncharacterized protein LOC141725789 [Zonotrichia albicollis]|uniref:uncharacterized protein LOC141725789 n=1 Tax=Zonotrichia albicollis TaxID=44394 RepID=UPI003D8108A0